MDHIITQACGYAASFFIIISFLIKNQKKLRTINLVGCIFFVIYGFRLDYAWPVIIPNAIIGFTQIYYLWIKPIEKIDSNHLNN